MNEFGKFLHRLMRSKNVENVSRLVALIEESTGRRFDAGEVEASMEDEECALAPLFFRSLQETFGLGEEEMAELGRAYMLRPSGPGEAGVAHSQLAR